jgi:hypothetical protein
MLLSFKILEGNMKANFFHIFLIIIILLGCSGGSDDSNNDLPNNQNQLYSWYKDSDRDGYSDGTKQISHIPPSPIYFLSSDLKGTSGDPDDLDPSVYPGAPTPKTWYKDADGDRYSDGNTITAVNRPSPNYYFLATELEGISGDTDDSDPSVFPGAPPLKTWYKDSDGDGYSDGTTRKSAREPSPSSQGNRALRIVFLRI